MRNALLILRFTSQAHVNTASAGDMPTAFSAAALESLEQNTMGDSWRGALDQEFAKPYFRKVSNCTNGLCRIVPEGPFE